MTPSALFIDVRRIGTRHGATIAELGLLYKAQYFRFLRVAQAIAGDEYCGAEAVQEAFAQALRARASFRKESPLEAWVWRIVVHAALAARASWPTEPLEPEVPAASNGRLTGDDYGVREWVAALPDRQRLVVFLRYFADLDYRGIAQALDIEVGTVSATLNAAHSSLRRSLKEAAQ